MSDTEEKTEQPTAQKLRKAREKGDVAQSKELTGSVSFLSVFMMLWLGADFWSARMRGVLGTALDAITANSHDPVNSASITTMVSQALLLIGPVFLLAVVAGLLTTFAQTRGVFSTEPLIIKFEKLNPGEALKSLFSTKQLGQLILMLLKLALLASVTVMTIRHYVGPMIQGIHADSGSAGNTMLAGMSAVRALFGACGAVFVVLSTLDFMQQYFEYIKKNKMSKSERKRERKDQDGDPHMRSELRSKRREIVDEASKRGVARANVVVTNPTHFSVALHYEPGVVDLPVVVAKGHDEEAFRIRREAAGHAIPVLESPPLARALYAQVAVGEPILPEHVEAVAEVFRWLKTLPSARSFQA